MNKYIEVCLDYDKKAIYEVLPSGKRRLKEIIEESPWFYRRTLVVGNSFTYPEWIIKNYCKKHNIEI